MSVRDVRMPGFSVAACLCFVLLLLSGVPVWGFDGTDVGAVRKMAEKGDPDAQSKLGVLYASGVGIKMDKQEAFSWYRKSAEQGHPVGQWNLAFMYVKGEGVASDYGRARELFRKSAQAGFANAQYDLGLMLLYGLGGDKDRAGAEKWLRMAAEQGYREAGSVLKEMESM